MLEGIKERQNEDLSNAAESESGFTSSSDNSSEEAFKSETSSLKDASVILYHPVVDAEYNSITQKLKLDGDILSCPLKDYDDFNLSVKVLQKGIHVTKYNYCQQGSQKHQLRLSKNRSILQYKPLSAFKSKVVPWKNLRLGNLQGLIYGGNTQTFLQNKKPTMKKMAEEKRIGVGYCIPHFDARRTTSRGGPLANLKRVKKGTNFSSRRPSGCLSSPSPRAALEAEVFYAWECLSLVRRDGSTFDLVVGDMHELLCLIHIVHRHVYGAGQDQEDDTNE